jgi:Enoyl-(Acyl carrier protein) reductase
VQATEERVDTVLNVNVKGTLFGCQLAAQHLADGGRIINISSSTTGLALPGYGIYDMTKGAIEQLTRIVAREIGRRGITVNAVSPGATETETYRQGKDVEFVAGLERTSVFNRLGRVEEIADVVAFLASDDAALDHRPEPARQRHGLRGIVRAAVIDRFGGPSELHPAELDDPPLRSGQVRIRVTAGAVGTTDAITRDAVGFAAGQRLLIVGATGAVGRFACQLAAVAAA